MAARGQGSGFAFLSTSFGFDIHSGRKPIDLAAVAAVDVDGLTTGQNRLNLAPLQETLDDLVFGALPGEAASGGGASSSRPAAFAHLFELGQLACELLLAEQDALVHRLEAAQRGSAKARKRALAYRERACGYGLRADALKVSNVQRTASLRKLQGHVLDARERVEVAEEAERRGERGAAAELSWAGARGDKENQLLRRATRLHASFTGAATGQHATTARARLGGVAATSSAAGDRLRARPASAPFSFGGGGGGSAALVHPWLTQPVHGSSSSGRRTVGPIGVTSGFGDFNESGNRTSSRGGEKSAGRRPRSASPVVQARSGGGRLVRTSFAHNSLAASAPAGYRAGYSIGSNRGVATRTGNPRVDEIATAVEVLGRRQQSAERAAVVGDGYGDGYGDEYDECDDRSSYDDMTEEEGSDEDGGDDDDDDDDDDELVADVGGYIDEAGAASGGGGFSTRVWAEGEVTLGVAPHRRAADTTSAAAQSTALQRRSTAGRAGLHPAGADVAARAARLAAQPAYRDSHMGQFFATTAEVAGDENGPRSIQAAALSGARAGSPASPNSSSCATEDGDVELLQVF
jgi:hypothetical protein